MNDFILCQQTYLYPDEEIYTDDTQRFTDWSDEYQGCESYMQYMDLWN